MEELTIISYIILVISALYLIYRIAKEKKIKMKKNPKKVNVKMFNIREEETKSTLKYNVPEGGSYNINNISGKLHIIDRDGNIIKTIDFQAGYSKEYNIIYK